MLLSRAELLKVVINFMRLLKFVLDEESRMYYSQLHVLYLDLINSSTYLKPLYPLEFFVIIV